MSKKSTNKKTSNSSLKPKKILDGIDTNTSESKKMELKKDNKETKTKKNLQENIKEPRKAEKNIDKKEIEEKEATKQSEVLNNNDINAKIQSVVSILFTIVIFIALLFLIFVLYNNYLKKDEELNLQVVCKDYIKKDYKITSEMIDNFIKNARSVIYNFDNFDREKITESEKLKFATYFIWGANPDYIVCPEEEEKCLVSKMEMSYDTLKEYFHNYLDIDDIDLKFNRNYTDDDKTRLYKDLDKVVLTFTEFSYQSLRHNVVYTNIDEDKVTIVFALEKLIDDSNIYEYTGFKKIELKYKNKNFIIEKIETSLKK